MLFIGSAAFAASTNSAVTNPAFSATATVETNDPVEAEYEKLLELDEAAGLEIDNWILENQKFAEQGAGVPKEELIRRIDKRRESVRTAYEDFIKRHPRHGQIRLAYASFLEDGRDLDGALEQMLKAKEIDPTNPAVWNNLANSHSFQLLCGYSMGNFYKQSDHFEKVCELHTHVLPTDAKVVPFERRRAGKHAAAAG